MNRKLNNKGYMLVEIIVASVIAFSVAYYLLNLVIKFKNINEDVYTNTVFQNDKVLIVKNIKNDIEQYTIMNYQLDKNNGIVDFTVKKDVEEKRRLTINKSNKTITYGKWDTATNKYITSDKSYYSKQLNNTLELGELTIDKSSDNNNVIVKIPVKSIYSDKTYDINIYFKYEKDEKKISEVVALGSYISYIPTSTSYSINTTLTGYNSNQTINPQELNLWRVIKKNEDGTVEIISEYVTNTDIYFRGQAGWKNINGSLNTIAKQYENNNFTTKSRHFGENGQVQNMSGNLSYGYGMQTSESENIKDTLYLNDINLLNTASVPLAAKNKTGANKQYWIASRNFNAENGVIWAFTVRKVETSGNVAEERFFGAVQSSPSESEYACAIRPIVTLKSTTKIRSGTGTSADPYKLQ